MTKHIRLTQNFSFPTRALLAIALTTTCISLLAQPALAKGRGRARAPQNCLRPTMYNVALQSQSASTRAFNSNVMMQGTGITSNGTVKSYNGSGFVTKPAVQIDPEGRNCDSRRGEVTGASGYCLLPYFSIAADPAAGYRMGDIIHVPDLEGTVVRLPPPPGKEPGIRHPGYFVVNDTGGAIKGKGRFDFFTGTWGVNDQGNPFGFQGDSNFGDLSGCKSKFEVIPQRSLQWKTKMELISRTYDTALNGRPQPVRRTNAPAAPAGVTR